MPIVCLPKINREKLLTAFKSGQLTIERLYQASEIGRREILEKYVGKENASLVNAKFEQAMLSNQKKAFANWIQRTTARTDPRRRDMLKKVESVKKFLKRDEEGRFMEDLAESKLGIRITEAEGKFLLDTKEKIDIARAKIPENSPIRSKERLEYGYAVDIFKQFIGERELGARTLTFREKLLPKNYWEDIIEVAGITKSLVATLDNSFIGRQGIKALYSNPKIWLTSASESIKNFGKELFTKAPEGFFEKRSDAIMSGIRADIYSRPNALNGKYTAAKNGYGLGVLHEEVFPTSLPERLPFVGRPFKASETAFGGTALRMRADLADAIIKASERNKIDMLDPKEATAHGKLVSSMTGRGDLGKLEIMGRELNVLMFSVKFLKSNFDTLTAHLFDTEMTRASRITAAQNTARIAVSITTVLAIADILGADVEWDPRSSRFGQICIDKKCFDMTGGMRGLVTLGVRMTPTLHNGEWGFWSKSGTTGKYTNMWTGEFGKQTALDTFENFFEGKASPLTGIFRDVWRGQNFQGEKPTVVSSTLGLITPISVQTLVEEVQKGNDDLLLVMLAEAFGISYYEYVFRGSGKKWTTLKEQEGDRVFNDSLKKVQNEFNERADKLKKSSKWKRMDNDEQSKELDKIRREETNKIFSKYNIK